MDPTYTNQQGNYSGLLKVFSGLEYVLNIEVLHKGVY